MPNIYFDYNATAPIRPEVRELMMEVMAQPANASSVHSYGRHAKKLLEENNQFTLEAIGFEAGFSSKSTFYATFKKVVDMTPSEFQKKSL